MLSKNLEEVDFRKEKENKQPVPVKNRDSLPKLPRHDFRVCETTKTKFAKKNTKSEWKKCWDNSYNFSGSIIKCPKKRGMETQMESASLINVFLPPPKHSIYVRPPLPFRSLPPTGPVDQRVLGDKYPGPRAHQPPIPATLLCHIVAEASLKRH